MLFRSWDVSVEGTVIAEDISALDIVGSQDMSAAAQLTLDYVAGDNSLNIVFGGDSSAHSDNNPILDAITLEANPDDGNGCDGAGGRVSNLIPGLSTGDCDFHPCVADGSCSIGVTGSVCRGGNGHAGMEACVAGETGGIENGIRICGAASQSSIGWGHPSDERAEPDRAIDGDRNSAWGGGSCTHTDGQGLSSWWQVDLGVSAAIDHADLWHRSECCPGRLHSATIVVSATPDFSDRKSVV